MQLNVKVVGVDNTGVDVIDPDGTERRIKSRCKVWAAGVSASPIGAQLAEQSGAEVDRAGRVKVNPDLSLPGHPEVFVVGDMIALNDLPGVARVAMQGGKHVAGQIKRRLAGRPTGQPFKYFDKGSMATISRFSAVAAIGSKIRFSGFIAWLSVAGRARDVPDRLQDRFTTMVHWAVSFLFQGRSQRTATRQQIVARTLMARLVRPRKSSSECGATPTATGPARRRRRTWRAARCWPSLLNRRPTRPERGARSGDRITRLGLGPAWSDRRCSSRRSFSPPVFTALLAAALVLGTPVARSGERGWARYSRITATRHSWVCAPVPVVDPAGGVPALVPIGGLWQRLSLVVGFAWLAAVATPPPPPS